MRFSFTFNRFTKKQIREKILIKRIKKNFLFLHKKVENAEFMPFIVRFRGVDRDTHTKRKRCTNRILNDSRKKLC